MDFEGFTFTPPGTKKELTPEEKKEQALAMLDKSLDDVIKEAREARGESGEKKPRSRKPKARPKIIKLDLSEREIERYVRQFSDIDIDGCDVRLRLVMTRDSRW